MTASPRREAADEELVLLGEADAAGRAEDAVRASTHARLLLLVGWALEHRHDGGGPLLPLPDAGEAGRGSALVSCSC